MNREELADLFEQQRDGLLDAAGRARLLHYLDAHPDEARWWQRAHSFDVRVAQSVQSYLDTRAMPVEAQVQVRARLSRLFHPPWLRGALIASIALIALIAIPVGLRGFVDQTARVPSESLRIPRYTSTPAAPTAQVQPAYILDIAPYPVPPTADTTRPTLELATMPAFTAIPQVTSTLAPTIPDSSSPVLGAYPQPLASCDAPSVQQDLRLADGMALACEPPETVQVRHTQRITVGQQPYVMGEVANLSPVGIWIGVTVTLYNADHHALATVSTKGASEETLAGQIRPFKIPLSGDLPDNVADYSVKLDGVVSRSVAFRPLTVVTHTLQAGDPVEMTGTLKNEQRAPLESLGVIVIFYDASGNVIDTASGTTAPLVPYLGAGQSIPFTVQAPLPSRPIASYAISARGVLKR